MRAVLGRPLGATAMRGHACMLNWIGELPDADAVLRVAGGHWHDYGKSPRQGRKVGHATVRCDTATDLMQVLRRIGQSLGRQDQVAPVVAALAGAPRSAEHTSELPSLMRIYSAVLCLQN